MNKQDFASYLEEIAEEIRIFELDDECLEDMYYSFIHYLNEFYYHTKKDFKLNLINEGNLNAIN